MGAFPDVWGEGNLFALSGFKNKTNWFYPVVGTLLENRIGFTIHTEREKTYWIALRSGNTTGELIHNQSSNCFDHFIPDILAGDILSLRCGIKNSNIHYLAVPLSANEILIRITPLTARKKVTIYFITRIVACKKIYFTQSAFAIKTDADSVCIRTNRQPDNYFVVDSMEEVGRIISGNVEQRARSWDGDKEIRYLVLSKTISRNNFYDIEISSKTQKTKRHAPIKTIIDARKKFYISRIHTEKRRTFAKAASILKVNIESPQGVFRQRWTTPDRWPHRHLWLWDSCFHALAYTFIDKKLAEDSLLSVIDTQQKGGFIPHIGRPDGNFSNITQPPLLSWASYKVYQQTKNKAFLRKMYPKLKAYLFWCLRNRDKNHNGLQEWARSDESGMDNSSRFNSGCSFDALDFSSILANDLSCLYSISREIGNVESKLKRNEQKINKKIQQYLWNKKEGFFFDRYFNGTFSRSKTACGFLPLFSGSATEQQAEHLIQHLLAKNEFHTPFPVPSESIDSPTFDNNMWRGPVWLNYNYFIIEGLKQYGFNDIAETLRRKTLREVEKWYRKEGTIFEFYDPFGKLSPRCIPRKDTYGAIKEFGWSAALYIVLFLNQ